MTFTELKTEILLRARKGGMCPEYHTVKLAANYQALITACIPLFLYGWKNDIMDDALLSEFDTDLLEDNGVYHNKTGAVVAPIIPFTYYDGYELIAVGGTPTISFTGNLKYKLTVVACQPVIETHANTYLELNVYDALSDISVYDNSTANIVLENTEADPIAILVEADASIVNDRNTHLELSIGSVGFAKLFGGKKSLANVDLGIDDIRIFAIASQQSTINFIAP